MQHWLLVRGGADRLLPERVDTRRLHAHSSTRPLAVTETVSEAPPVEAAGVFPRSLGRHSYIRLSPEQFGAARAAIQAIGSEH